MGKLWLLWLTFLVGLLFLFIPNNTAPKDFFPFYDIEMVAITYIYFIFEKIILIILALVILNESIEYRLALSVFLLLLCADLVDFLLTYNTVWFHFYRLPVSMNIVKVSVFGIVILYEWLWSRLSK